jgi:hypothetical protein
MISEYDRLLYVTMVMAMSPQLFTQHGGSAVAGYGPESRKELHN